MYPGTLTKPLDIQVGPTENEHGQQTHFLNLDVPRNVINSTHGMYPGTSTTTLMGCTQECQQQHSWDVPRIVNNNTHALNLDVQVGPKYSKPGLYGPAPPFTYVDPCFCGITMLYEPRTLP
eukprot:1109630-Pelagomonas_calceolata.AAC.8